MLDFLRSKPRGHFATYWPLYAAIALFILNFFVACVDFTPAAQLAAYQFWTILLALPIPLSALAVLRGRWWARALAVLLLTLFVIAFCYAISNFPLSHNQSPPAYPFRNFPLP